MEWNNSNRQRLISLSIPLSLSIPFPPFSISLQILMSTAFLHLQGRAQERYITGGTCKGIGGGGGQAGGGGWGGWVEVCGGDDDNAGKNTNAVQLRRSGQPGFCNTATRRNHHMGKRCMWRNPSVPHTERCHLKETTVVGKGIGRRQGACFSPLSLPGYCPSHM